MIPDFDSTYQMKAIRVGKLLRSLLLCQILPIQFANGKITYFIGNIQLLSSFFRNLIDHTSVMLMTGLCLQSGCIFGDKSDRLWGFNNLENIWFGILHTVK